MTWQPSFEGERPTLGWLVLDWIEENLVVPDGPAAGDPLVFTREQAQFVLELYEVDPAFVGPAVQGRGLVNGRVVRRAVLSRPKGWGKSPLVAALCVVEALGPVVLDGWDADGQPVGREWRTFGFKPKVQIVAVSEDQTANTWEPLLEMCRSGPVYDNYAIEPLEGFVNVPNGRIEPVTSSGTSREGFRPVFCALDQTESWTPSNGGLRLAATIRRNLGKVNGCSVETPNAFEPGVGSVAERSFEAFQKQSEGKTRRATGVLFDHREAPPATEPSDEASLRDGLPFVYGDSLDANGGWAPLERIVEEFYDLSTDPQDARRFYLNQITHSSSSWLSQPEWAARMNLERVVDAAEPVVLGFDGSRRRKGATTDATALVGCCVADGHVFLVDAWEQPDGPRGDDWQVPAAEVDAKVRDTFKELNVVGFYADPALWESYVAQWEAAYAKKLKVGTRQHPIEWWMTGAKATKAVEQFHAAVLDESMSHDGGSVLTRHVLNAHREANRHGVTVRKEFPDSPRKIDAAMAAVLAWQCRLDAVAKGVKSNRRPSKASFL